MDDFITSMVSSRGGRLVKMMADDRNALIGGLRLQRRSLPVERTRRALELMVLAGIAEALSELEPLRDEHGPLSMRPRRTSGTRWAISWRVSPRSIRP